MQGSLEGLISSHEKFSGGSGSGSSPSPAVEWSVLSTGASHTVALSTNGTL